MKNIIILFLLFTAIVSCDSKPDKPEPFLEHEQMVDIMTDMSLVEGTRIFAKSNKAERKEGEYSINDLYASVFDKYDINQAQLDSITAWYINFPEEYQSIFKEVLDRLNKMQAKEKAIAKELAQKKEAELKKKSKLKKEKEVKKKPKAINTSKVDGRNYSK